MSRTWSEFESSLDEEHLEEASFLFEQVATLRRDPEMAWFDIAAFDDRAEAHVDALELAGERAADLLSAAATADAGARRTALEVWSRRARPDSVTVTDEDFPLVDLVSGLDPEDPDAHDVLAEGLWVAFRPRTKRASLPAVWRRNLVESFRELDGPGKTIVARVGGELGWSELAERLAETVTEPGDDGPLALECVRALRRLRADDGLLDLWRSRVSSAGPALRRELATAALAGESAPLRREVWSALLESGGRGEEWVALPLALASTMAPKRAAVGGIRPDDPRVRSILRDLARRPEAEASTVFALGVLGDVDSIEPLIGALPEAIPEEFDPASRAEAAAAALQLITAADLWEEGFVPESIDPDTLLPAELARFERGEPPFGDQPPSGESVRRPAVTAASWRTWWEPERRRFRPDSIVRRGRVLEGASPAVIEQGSLDALRSALLPHAFRLGLEPELAIRTDSTADVSVHRPPRLQLPRL